mgnify:CR=1 FL=1
MSEPTIKAKGLPKSARRRARELALQGIYQWRLTSDDQEQIEKQILADRACRVSDRYFGLFFFH